MNKLPIILEYSSVEFEILAERVLDEKKDTREIDIKAKWQHADIININHRLYKRSLLEREIGKIMGLINLGESVWGLGFHPPDGLGKPKDITHVWTKVWMNPDGVCEGTLTLLPTTLGKEIQVLVKGGRKLGMSSRGFGGATERSKEINGKKVKYAEINDDYSMETPGDFVVSPAVPGAGNMTEEIINLESELNKDLDSKIKIAGDKKMGIENVEQLKKEYPVLVKQVEDEKELALKAETDKGDKTKDEKVADLETQVSDRDTKIQGLEKENTELKAWKDTAINDVRGLISKASDMDGVLPETDEDNLPPAGSEELNSELTVTKKSLEDANVKIKALEDVNKQREDSTKTEQKAEKLQTELKTKLGEVLATKEYEKYAELVTDEVTVDGKITIESVEDVEAKVKAAFEKINKIRSSEMKEKITSAPKEKGKVENPENEAAAAEETKKALYAEATRGGYKGTFDEWVEKHPRIVEQAG